MGPLAPAPETTIVLADDHAVLRAGARLVLERAPDLRVIGEAGSVATAEQLLQRRTPLVLLLDLHMPGGGLAAVSRLHGAWPAVRIVVFTMDEDAQLARAVLGAGAVGYVRKDAPREELVAAVRTTAAGGRYLDPEVGAQLLDLPEDPRPAGLTPREVQVLRLIALGYTNAEVAALVFLSVRTVEAQRAQLQRKLGASTRHELVIHALRQGLVTNAEEPG